MNDTHSPPPAGLATRGAGFWAATVKQYELSDGELTLLAEACRTLDNLDALDASIRENGAIVTGSMGQPVVNGALTEARGQRALLHRLLAALALPDADGAVVPSGTQMRGRKRSR